MKIIFAFIFPILSFAQEGIFKGYVNDIDDNEYRTIQLGTQEWLSENLKTTKYNDGSPVPNIQNEDEWFNLTSGAWCYYDNKIENNLKCGKLYNWYVICPITNGGKNICPVGWHVPTESDWSVLINYLGGSALAGGKLKEMGTSSWDFPNTGATNSSLFNGLAIGYRYDGQFINKGNHCNWWSKTEFSMESSKLVYLRENTATMFFGIANNKTGLPIRCIREKSNVEVSKRIKRQRHY